MDRGELERMLAEGASLEAIAQRVGKHPSTVGYWVQKHGLVAVNARRHRSRGGIDRETLAVLVDEGLTSREIARELDRSLATVRYWLNRHGLRLIRGRGVPAGLDPEIVETTGDCPRHGPVRYTRRRDGAWRCTACRSEAVTRRRRHVKATLIAEAGGRCVICGYCRSPAALHFHHLEPGEKEFHLAAGGMSRSLERARAEARKCILLCANCHAEVEAGDAGLPANILKAAADSSGSTVGGNSIGRMLGC